MSIHIQVSISDPNTHLFHVSMIMDEVSAKSLTLSMPVWIPGSYLVREYARHVQNVRAGDAAGKILSIVQQDKATWQVTSQDSEVVVVQYDVYAHDINVRANHLDDTHGFFNGVSLFMYPHGQLDEQVTLSIDAPESWSIFTGLGKIDEHTYLANDFNELFDCPVEIGPHDPVDFDVVDTPHQHIFWGKPVVDLDVLAQDTSKIVQAHADLFGGLPYKDYTFVTLLAPGGRGGLEHRNSTILYWDALKFRDGGPGSEHKDGMPTGKYLDYLRLVCHEHFHTWNVKRIRPHALGPFDYQNENYTRELWTVEGVTSYYEVLSLLRAQLMTSHTFLDVFAQSIQVLNSIPGRLQHSLEQASFNAWVKLYRPDANTRNSSVSYYLKGELVTFALDVLIRARTQNQRSFDDVLKTLWMDYQETDQGYPEGGYDEIIKRATGIDLTSEIDHLARSTKELPWDAILAELGLELQANHKNGKQPWLGVQTQTNGTRVLFKSISTGGPAANAGIYPQDELVALGGHQVTTSNVQSILNLFEPDATVLVHLFRRGKLITRDLTLAPSPPDAYSIVLSDDASDAQKEMLTNWLGQLPKNKSEI